MGWCNWVPLDTTGKADPVRGCRVGLERRRRARTMLDPKYAARKTFLWVNEGDSQGGGKPISSD